MTNPRTLIRWSGLALFIGGLVLVLHYVTHPPGETAEYTTWALWVPSHVLNTIGALLVLFGTIGWYARFGSRVGTLGFLAFVFLILMSVFQATRAIWAALILQRELAPLVPLAPQIVEFPSGPLFSSLPARVIVGLETITTVLGSVLFAVATLREGTLPRSGSLLIIAGLLVASGLLVSQVIGLIGGAIASVGIAWLGYRFWQLERTRRTGPA